MTDLIIKEVPFNDVTLIGIQKPDGTLYVAVRKICDDLGINFSNQLRRIKKEKVLNQSMVLLTIDSQNRGYQETVCLALDALPYFLIGVKDLKCKAVIQPYLDEFKLKAKDVLARAFLNPIQKDSVLKPEVEKPLTIAEMFLMSATAAVETERAVKILDHDLQVTKQQVEKTKNIVDTIVTNITQGKEQLRLFEPSKTIIPDLSKKDSIRKMVEAHSAVTGFTIQDTWNSLYNNFRYTHHTNLKAGAKKNKFKTVISYAEHVHHIDNLYDLACKMFL